MKNLERASFKRGITTKTKIVTFEGLRYNIAEDGDYKGAWISTKEVRDIYIPLTNNTTNLDGLVDQLKCQSYDSDKINKCRGKTLHVKVVEKLPYTNVYFTFKEEIDAYA